MKAQRGFSLIEVVVATAIAFVLGWLLIRVAHDVVLAAAHLDARLSAHGAADRLAEPLHSDAASAWSVFVPSSDVTGASNADGHELDFATEDASHRSYWWAYCFHSTTQNVVAYVYVPGGTPQQTHVYDGITNFTAGVHPVTALGQPSDPMYDPLFANATLTPVDVDFGWNAHALGGNHLVRAEITAPGVDRILALASGTAPSHFTVVVTYTPSP